MSGKKRTIIILEVIAAIIGLISAYGSSCPTFTPPTDPTSSLYIMNQMQWIFIITTLLSWAAAIGSGVLVWAIKKNKKWAYITAIITNITGFISGLIPALLIMLIGGSSFSPSLLRTFIYLIILILLLIPSFKEALFEDESEKGSVSTNLSAVLIIPGLILSLQTLIVAPTHIIDDVNVYMYNSLQLIGGLVMVAIGLFVFAIGRYRKKIE
ncbi:hypothetical protein DSAG12_01576 [Promethearchaeum syntrophicum]|uniref:Uncharacterized protein n=1 Tax=Promethearchaeum syntrophicum TaxID=2594042 RepID=A0A5B9D9A7_9ARCH|nr:hypothetical protein [Candidatus Prometheoarchaeum syntrophicum]QEE15749.1 hypothetical protein DSAG12_01576 [Candidatus Prometheoarchaeum syntrophicum]